MKVLAIFTESAVAKEGLTPTVDIYRLDTNVLAVDGAAMTEVGDGQYSYDFTAWDSSIDYSVTCDSVSLTGSERYAYSSISAARVIEDVLSTDDMLRLILSKEMGLATGGGSDLITFKSLDATKDRISMKVNSNGDRSTVVLDAA
jgi:hypothetical protein